RLPGVPAGRAPRFGQLVGGADDVEQRHQPAVGLHVDCDVLLAMLLVPGLEAALGDLNAVPPTDPGRKHPLQSDGGLVAEPRQEPLLFEERVHPDEWARHVMLPSIGEATLFGPNVKGSIVRAPPGWTGRGYSRWPAEHARSIPVGLNRGRHPPGAAPYLI